MGGECGCDVRAAAQPLLNTSTPQHEVIVTDEPASGRKGDPVIRFAATSRCIPDMHEALMTPKSTARNTPVSEGQTPRPSSSVQPRPHLPTAVLPAKQVNEALWRQLGADGMVEEPMCGEGDEETEKEGGFLKRQVVLWA